MAEFRSAKELLFDWLNRVMADKVIFTAVIDDKLAQVIGLDENTLDNIIRIIRNASREIIGEELATGRISNILIQRQGGLWKIVVFKERKAAK